MAESWDLYKQCITKQLEEVDLLSSIYAGPGELQIIDPTVISDFSEFIAQPFKSDKMALFLTSHIEMNISLKLSKTTLEVRISLPHLYPNVENPTITIHSTALNKTKELLLNQEMDTFINTLDKTEPYIFQILCWLQEHVEEETLLCDDKETNKKTESKEDAVQDFERLWIYSHHIKAKSKRQEIVKQAKNLELSGFSRPGKPGIICVEGLKVNTREFWRIIKSMKWQKITICKVETAQKPLSKFDKLRRFDGFKEQLFCADPENEEVEGVMNMSLFIKYLEEHHSGYMKKELFGLM